MKKVLLTSTAMVAFAGAAAAEVTLSGWAEMGVAGGSGQSTQFFQDVDVDFTLSGETDGGLTFGANVDLDEANSLGDTYSNQGVDIFVSGEFGTVTLGDTDGALDWALTDAASWGNPGSIAADDTAHWGRPDTYLDGTGDYDGQILRYDYSYDDFGFAVSLEQDDASDTELDDQGRDRYDYNWAVGARWNPELGAGTLKLGIGYQQADFGVVGFGLTDLQVGQLSDDITAADWTDDELDVLESLFGFRPQSNESDQLTVALGDGASVWGLSAGYEMDNGFSFGASYSDWDTDSLKDGMHWGIGAGYTFDAFTIAANYGEHKFDYEGGDAQLKAEGYGIAAGYDLGGGLSVLAGYGYSEAKISAFGERVSTDFDTYSFGLSMSF